ncbi:MAG: 50S ribosomal protein L15 [Rickettsiales bacterium]|nr:50S ribosomal protein L15 [Rickettsiales bacterium]|tara:strand:- start:17 stop:565 length:549 start_codon:yes stop_codon:yes gene_type:complete
MKLNQLKRKNNSIKSKKRLGRGIGSGKGKTCGRGMKGQKSRTGVAIKGFEGGQMPLHRRLPKVGFRNFTSKRMAWLNIKQLQDAIDSGKMQSEKAITEDMLIKLGIVKKNSNGVKLLGYGELKSKLNITVSASSKSAEQAIKKLGGSLIVQPKLKKTVQPKPAEKEDKKETIANVKKNKKDL